MRDLLSQWLRSTEGMALTEFALAIPFLLLLFMGSVELSRFIMVHQKLDKAANTVADVVAQANDLKAADMDQLLAAINDLADPYPFSAAGRVIISSVGQQGGYPRVKWQYCGGGSLTATSHVGGVGGAAAIPASLNLGAKEDIIIAEVFFSFEPMAFDEIVSAREVYKVAYFRPRLGALDDLTFACGS